MRGTAFAILAGFMACLGLGCGSSKAPGGGAGAAPKPGDARLPVTKDALPDASKLPDVLGSKGEFYGPHITVWVNGELYIDTAFRDSEEVSSKQLRNYLSRMVFQNTKQVRIKADEADPNTASLNAKFELRLADNRRKGEATPKMTFNELRLMRSPSEPETWVLTAEGIELIEKAVPKKQDERGL